MIEYIYDRSNSWKQCKACGAVANSWQHLPNERRMNQKPVTKQPNVIDSLNSLRPQPKPPVGLHHIAPADRTTADYGSVSAHAKVYVFADYHDVPILRNLALHFIIDGLSQTPDAAADALAFFQLIDYTYSNTVAASVASSNSLRKVVTVYAAHHAKTLWKLPQFGKLIECLGEFGRDLTGALLDLQQ